MNFHPAVSVATCSAPTLTEGLEGTGSGCDLVHGLATGGTCDFSCMSNYVINGATSVTCNSDGSLAPSVPTCDGKYTSHYILSYLLFYQLQ